MHASSSADPTRLDNSWHGFAWLLGEMARAQFFSTIWDKRAHHVARADPSFYADLANARDVMDIATIAVRLGEATRARPFIELVGGEKSAGTVHLRDNVDSIEGLWRTYGKGATILVQMAQRYWPPLARLCATIEDELRSPVDATLICTPAGSQAFGRHFDRLHSLVIQLSGRKQWRLFGMAQQNPVQDLPPLPFETATATRDRLSRWNVAERSEEGPSTSFTLEAGDFLYIPRGQYHEVWTEDEASAHVTLAVRPVTYVDLIAAALSRFAEADPAVRAALPVPAQGRDEAAIKSTAGILLAEFARSLDVSYALADLDAAHDAVLNSATFREGDFRETEISALSELEHVSKNRPTVIRGRGHADFYYGDRLFRLPDRAAPALDFIAQRTRFRFDEIPGLTAEGAKVLVRRLVRANVLRLIVQPRSHERKRSDEHQPLQ